MKLLRCASMASVSVAAIMVASTGAFAQTTNPETSPQSADPVASQSDGADIVVTGIRGSLQRAQDLKRNASSVIESVTLEDLGKFSDQNIADSLQRVPGVQIQRNDDGRSGDRLSVRGLGPQYVQVTVNGRGIVSFGNTGQGGFRGFNLDQLPSEVISGLTVFKSPVAENVEPGLGGLLDIATLRPLNYKSSSGAFFGSVDVRGEIDDLANSLRPRFSGVVGVKLFDDTLGLYVSGVRSSTRTRTDQVNVSYNQRTVPIRPASGPDVPTTFLAPSAWDFYSIDNERIRNTISGGLQWKPTPSLEINADWTYNNYDNNQNRQRPNIQTTGLYTNGPLLASEVTIVNGVLTGLTGTRLGVPSTLYESIASVENYKSKSNFGGVNVKWTNDRLTVSADYGRSLVDFNGKFLLGYGEGVENLAIGYALVNGLPTFRLPSPTPQSEFAYFLFNDGRQLKSDRNSYRLDLEYKLSSEFKLKAGVRYEESSVDSRGGGFFSCLPASGNLCGPPPAPNTSNSFGAIPREETFTPAELTALNGALFPGSTYNAFASLGLGVQRSGNLAGFCVIVDQLCGADTSTGSYFTGAFPTNSANDGSNNLPLNASNTFLTRERNLSLYASVDGRGSIAGAETSGNLGLRAVRISEFGRGFSQVRVIDRSGFQYSNVSVPTIDTNEYWQFLPSLNINLRPSEKSAIRLGIARSLTLPEYNDLAPLGSVTIFNRNVPSTDPNRIYDPARDRDSATFGNTQLNPITAWNYDLTFEYYTPYGGSVVVSGFYKDISNFILVSRRQNQPLPGQTILFDVIGPENIAKANAKGFEIGVNQPFGFLPAPFDGFGIQANYTYVETSIDSDRPDAKFGIPGSSRNNVNIIAYYEKYGLGVRLGYTYRSDFLLGLGQGTFGNALSTLQAPIQNLDLNVSYAITKNFEINGSVNNLTRETRTDYFETRLAPASFYERPRFFTFGARYKF